MYLKSSKKIRISPWHRCIKWRRSLLKWMQVIDIFFFQQFLKHFILLCSVMNLWIKLILLIVISYYARLILNDMIETSVKYICRRECCCMWKEHWMRRPRWTQSTYFIGQWQWSVYYPAGTICIGLSSVWPNQQSLVGHVGQLSIVVCFKFVDL